MNENCKCDCSGNTVINPIEIKYFDKSINKLEILEVGDWIDLRVRDIVRQKDKTSIYDPKNDTFSYLAFTFFKVYLNVAMKLPEGYEALVSPRGSMFKETGLIQTNSPGVVDNTYCGDKDEWFIPCFSLTNGTIGKGKGQRICQFRLFPTMKSMMNNNISFREVNTLGYKSRGGHGSTGKY